VGGLPGGGLLGRLLLGVSGAASTSGSAAPSRVNGLTASASGWKSDRSMTVQLQEILRVYPESILLPSAVALQKIYIGNQKTLADPVPCEPDRAKQAAGKSLSKKFPFLQDRGPRIGSEHFSYGYRVGCPTPRRVAWFLRLGWEATTFNATGESSRASSTGSWNRLQAACLPSTERTRKRFIWMESVRSILRRSPRSAGRQR